MPKLKMEAQKVVIDIRVDYIIICACLYNTILYYKEYDTLESCHKYQKSRYWEDLLSKKILKKLLFLNLIIFYIYH